MGPKGGPVKGERGPKIGYPKIGAPKGGVERGRAEGWEAGSTPEVPLPTHSGKGACTRWCCPHAHKLEDVH